MADLKRNREGDRPRGRFGDRASSRTSRFGDRNSSGNRSGDRDHSRDRFKADNPLEMHDVTCDKCGKQCQVPFKPTSGKPVYCKECFGGIDRPRPSQPTTDHQPTSDQLDGINKKLDKIIAALGIN